MSTEQSPNTQWQGNFNFARGLLGTARKCAEDEKDIALRDLGQAKEILMSILKDQPNLDSEVFTPVYVTTGQVLREQLALLHENDEGLPSIADDLHVFGTILEQRGEESEAYYCQNTALPIYSRLGNNLKVFHCQLALARLAARSGQHDSAADRMKQAMQSQANLPDKSGLKASYQVHDLYRILLRARDELTSRKDRQYEVMARHGARSKLEKIFQAQRLPTFDHHLLDPLVEVIKAEIAQYEEPFVPGRYII